MNLTVNLQTITYTASGCDRSDGRTCKSVLTLDVYEEPQRSALDGQLAAGRIWLDVDATTVAKWDAVTQAHRASDLPVNVNQYMFTHGTEHYRAGARAALAAIDAAKSGTTIPGPPGEAS